MLTLSFILNQCHYMQINFHESEIILCIHNSYDAAHTMQSFQSFWSKVALLCVHALFPTVPTFRPQKAFFSCTRVQNRTSSSCSVLYSCATEEGPLGRNVLPVGKKCTTCLTLNKSLFMNFMHMLDSWNFTIHNQINNKFNA